MDAERAEQLTGEDPAGEEIDPEKALPSGPYQALVLHIKGWPYRGIAKHLGISVSTAHDWVHRAITAVEFRAGGTTAEATREDHRLNEWYSRLEAAWTTHSDLERLERGVRMAVALSKERRALLGLDQPRQLAVRMEPEQKEPTVDMATINAFAEEVDRYDRRKAEVQANDGLDAYDS